MTVAIILTGKPVAGDACKVQVADAVARQPITYSLVGALHFIVSIICTNCNIVPGFASWAFPERAISANPVCVRARICLPARASILRVTAVAVPRAVVWARRRRVSYAGC